MDILLPTTCKLTTHPSPALTFESFRRTYAWRPVNHLWVGEATPQHRVLLPPAVARALSRRLATVRSSVVLVQLNARAGSSTLTRRSLAARRRSGRCGCACLARGERVRRPCPGPRGGHPRLQQSLPPWEPDGDTGGAGAGGGTAAATWMLCSTTSTMASSSTGAPRGSTSPRAGRDTLHVGHNDWPGYSPRRARRRDTEVPCSRRRWVRGEVALSSPMPRASTGCAWLQKAESIGREQGERSFFC
jgi:hypothetical protein